MRVSSKEVTRKDHSKRRHVIALAVIGGGSVLFVCAVAVLAMRSGRREVPLPPVPEATGMPSEVRVKPVVPKDAARTPAVAASASRAVAVVCGEDAALVIWTRTMNAWVGNRMCLA